MFSCNANREALLIFFKQGFEFKKVLNTVCSWCMPPSCEGCLCCCDGAVSGREEEEEEAGG